jgi:hypothetical protein
MMAADHNNPILAGRFSIEDGKESDFVVAPDFLEDLNRLPAGLTYVRVSAPNGAAATGSVDFSAAENLNPRIRYDLLAGMLSGSKAETGHESARIARSLAALPLVALWRLNKPEDVQPISPADVSAYESRLAIRAEQASFLEFSPGRNAYSFFVRLPPTDTDPLTVLFPPTRDLYTNPGKNLGLARIASLTTTDQFADAFFGFLRADLTGSADLVGSRLVRIASKALEHSGSLSVINRIALAHIAVRGGLSEDELKFFRRHFHPDNPITTPDLYALEWLIDFKHADTLRGLGKRLLDVLNCLKANIPIYSETIRQMVGISSYIREELEDEDQYPPEIDEKFNWLRKVCEAMVWGLPYTTYHGTHPLIPVALTTPVAKKK